MQVLTRGLCWAGRAVFFADDTHHLGELGEAACRDSESGPPPPPSLPPPPPPPAQDSGPPDCLQMVYDRSDAMTTACCANPADCETGAPTRCSEDCSDVLEPYFEICSGWVAGDPDFGAVLQPLIGMCEEAKFGAYSGSLFSHRCSTAAILRATTTAWVPTAKGWSMRVP